MTVLFSEFCSSSVLSMDHIDNCSSTCSATKLSLKCGQACLFYLNSFLWSVL